MDKENVKKQDKFLASPNLTTFGELYDVMSRLRKQYADNLDILNAGKLGCAVIFRNYPRQSLAVIAEGLLGEDYKIIELAIIEENTNQS